MKLSYNFFWVSTFSNPRVYNFFFSIYVFDPKKPLCSPETDLCSPLGWSKM
ncbi:hypothetical protein Hanom_Chr09g00804331 [Helianthus anomalus]